MTPPDADARRRQLVAVSVLAVSVSGAAFAFAALSSWLGRARQVEMPSPAAILVSLTAARALLAPAIGWVCDRLEPRRVMVWASILAGAGWCATAYQDSRPAMFASATLALVGGQFVTIAAFTHLIRWRPARMGRALGIVNAAYDIGTYGVAYGAFYLASVRGASEISSSIVLVGFAAAAAGLTATRLLAPVPPPLADVFGEAEPGDATFWAETSAAPAPLWVVLSVVFLGFLGFTTFSFDLGSYVREAAEAAGVAVPSAAYQWHYASLALVIAAGAVLFGSWSDRGGRLAVLARGLAIAAALTAGLLLVPGNFTAFLGLSTLAVGSVGCLVAGLGYVADFVAPRRLGFALGVLASLEALASVLSRVIAGLFGNGSLPEPAAAAIGALLMAVAAGIAFTAAGRSHQVAPALAADAED